MPFRSWIAVLLLINYLLVAGMGCMSRPEDQHELMLVKTDVAGPYQECRYVRMDGLNELLNEALASRYLNAPDTTFSRTRRRCPSSAVPEQVDFYSHVPGCGYVAHGFSARHFVRE